MTASRTATRNRPAGILAEVVVVTCRCGFYPLDKAMHRDARSAWRAAADHVSLNPDLCHPNMHRDLVPAALASVR